MSYYGGQKQLNDLRKLLAQIQNTLIVKIADMDAQIARINGRLDTIEARIDSLAHAVTLSITAPANGATVSGSVAFSATCTCPSAHTIKSVIFYIWDERSGWVKIAEDTVSPYTTTLDTTQYSNTSHKLRAVGACVSGGQSTQEITVTINNVIPTGGTKAGGSTTGYGCVVTVQIDSPTPGSAVDPAFKILGRALSSIGHKITSITAKRQSDGAVNSGTVDDQGNFGVWMQFRQPNTDYSDTFLITATCVNGETGSALAGYINAVVANAKKTGGGSGGGWGPLRPI